MTTGSRVRVLGLPGTTDHQYRGRTGVLRDTSGSGGFWAVELDDPTPAERSFPRRGPAGGPLFLFHPESLVASDGQ